MDFLMLYVFEEEKYVRTGYGWQFRIRLEFSFFLKKKKKEHW